MLLCIPLPSSSLKVCDLLYCRTDPIRTACTCSSHWRSPPGRADKGCTLCSQDCCRYYQRGKPSRRWSRVMRKTCLRKAGNTFNKHTRHSGNTNSVFSSNVPLLQWQQLCLVTLLCLTASCLLATHPASTLCMILLRQLARTALAGSRSTMSSLQWRTRYRRNNQHMRSCQRRRHSDLRRQQTMTHRHERGDQSMQQNNVS
jgi:hypothetical protein